MLVMPRSSPDPGITIENWLETMSPWVIEVHMNNNNGVMDEHYGFDWDQGVLDYSQILPQLRQLPAEPVLVLEMDRIADMQASLHYFELDDYGLRIGKCRGYCPLSDHCAGYFNHREHRSRTK